MIKTVRARKQYQERQKEDTNLYEVAYMAEVPTNRALFSVHSKEWVEAMAFKVKSLINMNTWELVA